jgi:hypothetical protein
MSHALATVLHRGRKAASNVMTACLASSREARRETAVAGSEYDRPPPAAGMTCSCIG